MAVPLRHASRPCPPYRTWTLLYIALYCLVWWGIYSLVRDSLDGRDMVESFAWGMEWQWGNDKHPPLTGWIVAAWFSLAPHTDSAYYLLNQLSLAIALWLMALAMRVFMPWESVLVGVVLTTLSTHFGPDMGFKYNANSAMLPFVAGLAWSLAHAFDNGRVRWCLTAGAFAGAMLLVKYYAPVLVLGVGLCLLHAQRPAAARLVKCVWIGGVSAVLIVAPHILWSYLHDWPGMHYMRGAHRVNDFGVILAACAVMLGDSLHFNALACLVWGLSLVGLASTDALVRVGTPRVGLGIFVVGIALTVLTSVAQRMAPVSQWIIPVLLFAGWALADLTPKAFDTRAQARRVLLAALVYLVFSVIAAGWRAGQAANPAPPARAWAQTVARDATRLYHEAYGQPVELVAASFPLGYTMSFYSQDHPHALRNLDPADSPWIDKALVQNANKMALCGSLLATPPDDPGCPDQARQFYGTPDRVDELVYPVYDPLTRQTGSQRFQVLMWKPLSRQ